MNFMIQVDSNQYREWTQLNDIYVTGFVYFDNKIFQKESLIELILDSKNPKELIRKCCGFFAIIIYYERNNEILIIVDRVRSIPLFYGNNDSCFYVSSSANNIRKILNLERFDPQSMDEFLLTGYVTGEDTLFKEIKQVQAGEMVEVNASQDLLKIEKKRYYSLPHSISKPEYSSEYYLKNLNKTIDQEILRLLDYANGRQIVIPLSAGRDSRLLLLKLKEHGYDNIVCFSYGIVDNFEAKISQKIANEFGYPWYFFEYSESRWKDLWGTDTRRKYYDYGSNWVSLPHIQDFPAVQLLSEKKIIQDNALFLPGHSGDFIAGSHIPLEIFQLNDKINEDNIINIFYRKHYSLVKDSIYGEEHLKKIKDFLPTNYIETIEEFIHKFEIGDWQERQAKYIVNSVRVYEFFGYDWYMPFWEKEVVDYLCSLPLSLRMEKKLYNEYVDSLYIKMGGEEKNNSKYIKQKKMIIKVLKKFKVHKLKSLIRPGKKNILGIYGYYPYEIPKKTAKNINRPDGFATMSFINEHNKYTIR